VNKKMLSRRDFLRVSALTTAGAVLAGCGPSATPTPEAEESEIVEATEAPKAEGPEVVEATEAPEAAPVEEVKMTIMWRTNVDENPMIDDLMPMFESKNPGVSLEAIYVPWDEYEPKLMTMYAANEAPDIYGTGGTNPYIERWVRGMVVELNSFLDQEGPSFTDDLYPVGLNSYTKGGKTVAMTFAVLAAGTWINATRFDEAGVEYPPIDWTDEGAWTWDDVIETAKKLTLDSDSDGRVDLYGFNPSHASPWTYTRLWGQDLISDEDYQSGILHGWQTNDSAVYEALVEGLQARADAMHEHEVAPSPDTAQSLEQMGAMLKTGAIAMDFAGGWAVWGDLPEEFEFRGAINPKGGVNGSGTRVRNTWAEPLQICSQTKYPNEAWQWVKFMTVDKDALARQMQARNLIPAARSSFDAYIEGDKDRLAMSVEDQKSFYGQAIEQAETTVPCHILVGWAAVRDVFNSELEPIWLGEKTAREAVDEMLPKIQAAIDENLEALDIS
jgi:multiple sugar transport system substrate-binding protein